MMQCCTIGQPDEVAFDTDVCAATIFPEDRATMIAWGKRLANAIISVARKRQNIATVEELLFMTWEGAAACTNVTRVWMMAGPYLADPTVRSLHDGLAAISQRAVERLSAGADAFPPLPGPPGKINWLGATLIGFGLAGGIFAAVKFWPRR